MLKNDETAIAQLVDGVDWKKPKFDGFRNNPYVAKLAVVLFPTNMEYVSLELRDNKEFVLSCMKSSHTVLSYASDRLKNDAELHLMALAKNDLQEDFFHENCGEVLKQLINGKPDLCEALLTIKNHKLVDLAYRENEKGLERPKVHRKCGNLTFTI